ncbi:hypothetical protein B1C78_09185 [Thioalkalivibrio denitrificans]|uniref:Uncharacterized protein n=1 Tax=Thioalkalivibrio denitrificans TaxID=108003 RepID=A0A1V3NGL8_9GAMM|nr:hypothetical protein [Thioalkalivibrio denitrificans]OOG24249.1 hypothetical protein B1C78_09185 [Thioalkalivibrio denitrificans]
MQHILRLALGACLAIATFSSQAYEISRHSDGSFNLTISGIAINSGSSLERESILFNDPSSPVQIRSHATAIAYQDRAFRFAAETIIVVDHPIRGLQLRTIQYDAFGQHMSNLANTEIKDFGAGEVSLSAQWRARETDITRLLTSVTYIARVRLADGSQWVYDQDELIVALRSLNLEQKIGDDGDSE